MLVLAVYLWRFPTLLVAYLPLILLVALVLWVLTRFQLGWLMLLGALRGGSSPGTRERPSLHFRVSGVRGVHDVELVGHRQGVGLGDHVRLWTPGTRPSRPFVVANLTTGRTLVRTGLLRRALVAAVALWVIAWLI